MLHESASTLSNTEFVLEEENKDAIIHAAAYHRRDYDRSVIYLDPSDDGSVGESLLHTFPQPPTAHLGTLRQLPLEILHEICLYLDFESLFRFQQINRRSRQIIGALRHYQPLVEHGQDFLRVLMKTRAAGETLMSELFATFCSEKCAVCGSFGSFVFLLSCTRSCADCLQQAPQLQAVTLSAAANTLRTTPKTLRKIIPSLCIIPGIYTTGKVPWKNRIHIVAAAHLQQLQPPKDREIRANLGKPIYSFLGTTTLPYFDDLTKTPQHGLSCGGCQVAVELGLVTPTRDGWQFRDRVYSCDGFLRHFQWCAQAQDLWKSSLEGDSNPTKSEWIRRGGWI